ncbi:MAG: hypothetical protein RBS99_19740, partial [Rhodospirillales bacterium]|nr:hypothetical protein [Rhodospirillales bacterium]
MMIPTEIASLVHYTELNKVGWWDSSKREIIKAILYFSGGTLDAVSVVSKMKGMDANIVHDEEFASVINKMKEDTIIIEKPKGVLKLTESARNQMDKENASNKQLDDEIKELYYSALDKYCENYDRDDSWAALHQKFIVPTVQRLGA